MHFNIVRVQAWPHEASLPRQQPALFSLLSLTFQGDVAALLDTSLRPGPRRQPGLGAMNITTWEAFKNAVPFMVLS